MKINLKLYGRFNQIFQTDEQEIRLKAGATVLDLLNTLCQPDELRKHIFSANNRNLKPNVSIRKNGRFIVHLNWLETVLEAGDRVEILTLHCGG